MPENYQNIISNLPQQPLPTGILCGPFALALLSSDANILITYKRVEQGCLSIIGFTAGTELLLKELRASYKAIALIVSVMLPTVAACLYATASQVLPGNLLFQGFGDLEKRAAVLLTVSVLLARSPASAIAVVKEAHADGAFTKICVCASIVLDTCVVSIFSININFAHMIVDGTQLTIASAMQPIVKLLFSVVMGFTLKRVLLSVFQATGASGFAIFRDTSLRFVLRGLATFLTGVLTFVFSDILRDHKVYCRIDPLLSCIMAGALFVNTTYTNTEDPKFGAFMEESLPWTNIPFFTLVGCGMSFSGLSSTMTLVALLFAARIIALMVSGYASGTLAGLPAEHNHLRWMGFITQAGVAIGLAKQVALEFPAWGPSVQALCVMTILVNLMFGPIAFKWLLIKVGEAPSDEELLGRMTAAAPGAPQSIWGSGTGSPTSLLSGLG